MFSTKYHAKQFQPNYLTEGLRRELHKCYTYQLFRGEG